MLGTIIICALAAGGLLLLSWAVFGWLTAPFGRQNAVVILRVSDPAQLEQELRAWSWLRRSGMLAAELLLCPTPQMQAETERRCETMPELRLCRQEELPDYLEMELSRCSRNRN